MRYLKKCINADIRKNRILIKQGKVNPAMGEIIIKVREIQKKRLLELCKAKKLKNKEKKNEKV